MKLIIICRHITKIVQTVSRRTSHSWVSCPSRRAKTTRISASACRLKHIFTSDAIAAAKRLRGRFTPINKRSENVKIKAIFPRDSTYYKGGNHHPKHNQYKSMAPNKFKNFQVSIKSMLKFMNCRYLHCLFIFVLDVLSLAPQFLKSHVFLRDYGEISRYSGQNHHAIWLKT